MTTIQTPAINITSGLQLDQAWRLTSAYPVPRSPVDLSLWTAEIRIGTKLNEKAEFSKPLTLDAGGNITLTIGGVVTATISDAIPDGRAFYQINLNAPDPEFSQVWQGGVTITRAVE